MAHAKVAESTLAMTALNELATAGPGTVAEIVARLKSKHEIHAEQDVEHALAVAHARARVRREGEVWSSICDGWVVFRRDRTGDGWGGWVVRSLRTGQQRSF